MSMKINIVSLVVLLLAIVVCSNKTAKGRAESNTEVNKVFPKRRAIGIVTTPAAEASRFKHLPTEGDIYPVLDVCDVVNEEGVVNDSTECYHGDLIAKVDFLPIATRLRKKVEHPGEGNGIVSSSKSNQELADKLFANFFLTKSSIVLIQDEDIPGLNSFQALALCGSEYEPETHFFSVYRYYIPGSKYIPRYSRYLLLSRPMEIKESNSSNKTQERKRHSFNILKEHSWYSIIQRKNNTLGNQLGKPTRNQTIDKSGKHKQNRLDKKKRTIKKTDLSVDAKERKAPAILEKTTPKINTSNNFEYDPRYYQSRNKMPKKMFRRYQKDRKREEAEKFKALLQAHYRKQVNSNSNKIYFERFRKIDKSKCYWKFKCDYAMAWCQLIPECSESENKFMDDIPIDHKRDEHNEDIKMVRDMLGIYLVDEEVEKILIQRRGWYMRSQNNRVRPLVGRQIDQPVINQYLYSSKENKKENEALSVKEFFDALMQKQILRESDQLNHGPKKTTRPQFNYLGERVTQPQEPQYTTHRNEIIHRNQTYPKRLTTDEI